MSAPRFATVVLDVDSTLTRIEGIDWLAARRSSALAERVTALTHAAMAGTVAIDAVYGERVNAVAPSEADIQALSVAYIDALAPGAVDCIAELRRAGVRVVVLSGGVRQAILRLARLIGVRDDDVYAVALRFDATGAYAGYDTDSPLTQSEGKRRLLESIRPPLPRPILHVGDGITDAETRGAVDAFAAYTGFVNRPAVAARADVVVKTFEALKMLAIGDET